MLVNLDSHAYTAIAAFASTLGTLALKLIDRAFHKGHGPSEENGELSEELHQDRRRVIEAEAVALERRELLDERIELRNRLATAEAAVVEWREKYFAVVEQNAELKARVVSITKPQ
jgi:hypothetical protein